MKFLVPAAALLIALVALGIRLTKSSNCPERVNRTPKVEEAPYSPVKLELSGLPATPLRIESEKIAPSEPQARRETKTIASTTATLERSRLNMLDVLESELELGPEQTLLVARVLYDRQMETEAYFKELRSTGILSSDQFERRVEDIRERSYRRMGQVLNAAQYEIYGRLLAQGKFRDTVAFELTPDVAVLD